VDQSAPTKTKENMTKAHPLEKKRWWFGCTLFGMNSLEEGAL
jgi:hypothetical protein